MHMGKTFLYCLGLLRAGKTKTHGQNDRVGTSTYSPNLHNKAKMLVNRPVTLLVSLTFLIDVIPQSFCNLQSISTSLILLFLYSAIFVREDRCQQSSYVDRPGGLRTLRLSSPPLRKGSLKSDLRLRQISAPNRHYPIR